MKIIKCGVIAEFDSAMRKYYNLTDIRVSDVNVHNSHTKDLYHSHTIITEILFVIDGTLEVKLKNDNDIQVFKVNRNQIVVFSPNDVHCVKSVDRSAHVIVFKYVKNTDKNLLDLFIGDWESD